MDIENIFVCYTLFRKLSKTVIAIDSDYYYYENGEYYRIYKSILFFCTLV